MFDTINSRVIIAYVIGLLGLFLAFIIVVLHRDSAFYLKLTILLITLSMWFIGFGTGLSKARGKPFMQNKKRIEIQTMVDKLNHEGNLMVREAKEKQSEDLKERPLFVLTKGDLVSYVHDPYREPYIQEMVMRYNNKEYTFKISSISIKDKK